jgi:molybdopterin molybdotransferase
LLGRQGKDNHLGVMSHPLDSPQKISRLTPLKDALDRIASEAVPVAARECALADAVGRVLAEDVVANAAHPAQATALRDGVAVRADDTTDASSYAPVRLSKMQVVQVGDGMPDGADAVAWSDSVTVDGGSIAAIASVAAGDGVLAAGADVQAGRPLRRAGEKLRTIDVAVLQALGVAKVNVCMPRVRIVAEKSGDVIIDAITGWVHRWIVTAGGDVLPSSSSTHFKAALGAGDADFIVAVGGSGAGVRDVSIGMLEAAGHLHFHGIGISPGETSALGFSGNAPVLIVPGRIDAAFAAFATMGEAIMAQLCGLREVAPVVTATLERKVVSIIGLVEIVPVKLNGTSATPLANGYLPMQAMMQADGYIEVSASSEGAPAGTSVAVRMMP